MSGAVRCGRSRERGCETAPPAPEGGGGGVVAWGPGGGCPRRREETVSHEGKLPGVFALRGGEAALLGDTGGEGAKSPLLRARGFLLPLVTFRGPGRGKAAPGAGPELPALAL